MMILVGMMVVLILPANACSLAPIMVRQVAYFNLEVHLDKSDHSDTVAHYVQKENPLYLSSDTKL